MGRRLNIAACAAAAISMVVLGACSGSDDEASTTESVPAEEPQPSEPTSTPIAAPPSTETTASSTTTTTDPLACDTDRATRGAGEERERCVDGRWTPDPFITAPTTTVEEISDESRQVVTNLLIVSGLRDGDPEIADFRDALVGVFEDDLRFDRVNIVTGEVSDDGAFVVVDATTGYSTEEYQIEEAVSAVYEMATGLWTADLFGAQTDEGNGALGFKFTSDGRQYVLPGDVMVAIRDRRISAEEAMGV